MKIYSKFHDYYDTVRAYGEDSNVSYMRKTEDIFDKQNEAFGILNYDIPKYYYNFWAQRRFLTETYEYAVILFCGEFHRIILSSTKSLTSLESVKDIYQNIFKDESCAKKFFGNNGTKKKEYINLHIKYNAPIIVIRQYWDGSRRYHGIKYVLNDRLKDYNFQTIYDPFTAYQKIEMFLGNDMVVQKNKEEVSDSVKIHKHGFDEWSFRKKKV